jgi:hypothetical protein
MQDGGFSRWERLFRGRRRLYLQLEYKGSFGAYNPTLVYNPAMSSPQVESEIRRLADLLEAVLRYRGGAENTGLRVGARAIERKLGWSAGTLSRVLKGKIEIAMCSKCLRS